MPGNNNFTAQISDESINQIVGTLKENVPEEVKILREIQDTTEVDENAKLGIVSTDLPNEPSPIDLIAAEVENISDEDIYDPEADTDSQKKMAEKAKDDFDLTEDEMYQLLDTMSKLKDNPKYPVYQNIPKKFQDMVKSMAAESGIPSNQWNAIARMIINEMISDTGLQSAMIDLEQSLNQALSLPSISDMYSEHTREVMEKHIPETIEKIKEESPEKAEVLGKVKDAFIKSYTFSFAKESYANNTAIRKAVRRADNPKELKRVLNDFNAVNEKSKFKMNDVTELPDVLKNTLNLSITKPSDKEGSNFVPEYVEKIIEKVKSEEGYNGPIRYIPWNVNATLLDGKLHQGYGYLDLKDPDVISSIKDDDISIMRLTLISPIDVDKFCMLIAKSCMNMDPLSIIDATYMYYMMRNILMLKHAQEAKTDFAAELISNIIETISFITDEEAKFYAEHQDRKGSKPSK